MANRKLQGEVDRTIKKVNEGIDLFDSIWDKVYSTTNQTQREKYEAELKKEIKKLQRLREQIRTWIGGNEIKDKKKLQELRRTIERRMEKFKVCEKESKLKEYSKEALNRAHQKQLRDIENKESGDAREAAEWQDWIQNCIESIQEQVQEAEEELDIIIGATSSKKKKSPNSEVDALEARIETHKSHIAKLEQVLEILETRRDKSKVFEKIREIKEGVEYYIESNEEEDFVNDDYLYDGIIAELDEEDEEDESEEDFSPVESPREKDEEEKKVEKKEEKQPSKQPSPPPVQLKKPIPTPTKQPQQPQYPPQQIIQMPPMKQPSPQPIIKEDKKKGKKKQEAVPQVIQMTQPSPKLSAREKKKLKGKKDKAPTPTPTPPLPMQQTPPLRPMTTPSPPPNIIQQKKLSFVEMVSGAQEKKETKKEVHQQPTMTTQQMREQQKSPLHPSPQMHSLEQQEVDDKINDETFGSDIVLSGLDSLEELSSQTLDAHKTIEPTKDAFDQTLQILQNSLNNMPHTLDTERARPYIPVNPYNAPDCFPTKIPPAFNDPSIFEKMDTDTLFFIFYYQQGTYQQYLAAKELKKQAWRYHKKYLTWFQRHDQPKVTTNDYELGTYVYFDYETGWCQRIKSGFRFEYEYLEDELPVS